MEAKMTNKPNKSWKVKLTAILILLVIFGGLGFSIFRHLSVWYDTHEIEFNEVVKVEFNTPITIKEREVEVKEIVKVINAIPNPVDLKTDTEKYIYEKFGLQDYKVAIAVARAESGLREDAININSNNTIDVGIFQINQVHFKKEGCSLKELATYKGNIDCAYKIFQASGWNPWVAFTNGSFINKLK
jgi:hypothetical protein